MSVSNKLTSLRFGWGNTFDVLELDKNEISKESEKRIIETPIDHRRVLTNSIMKFLQRSVT